MSTFPRRQLAIRRLCLDGQGNLNRDARVVAAYLRRLCAGNGRLLVYTPQGQLDPVATAAAAARREVWDDLRRLLNLDAYQETNLTEE